jgi:hypothetical protein
MDTRHEGKAAVHDRRLSKLVELPRLDLSFRVRIQAVEEVSCDCEAEGCVAEELEAFVRLLALPRSGPAARPAGGAVCPVPIWRKQNRAPMGWCDIDLVVPC